MCTRTSLVTVVVACTLILVSAPVAHAQAKSFQRFLEDYNLTYLMPNQKAEELVGAVIEKDKAGRAHPLFPREEEIVNAIERDPVQFPAQAEFEKTNAQGAVRFLQPFMSLAVTGGYQRVKHVFIQIIDSDKDLLHLGAVNRELEKLGSTHPDYVKAVKDPTNYVVIGVVRGRVVFEFLGKQVGDIEVKSEDEVKGNYHVSVNWEKVKGSVLRTTEPFVFAVRLGKWDKKRDRLVQVRLKEPLRY